MRVVLDFANVKPINSKFLTAMCAHLVATSSGNNLLSKIKLEGCGDMVKSMLSSIIEDARVEYWRTQQNMPAYKLQS